MKSYNSIICTDEVNKYNEIIPMNTLFDTYKKQWSLLIPMYVNHDHKQPLGISQMNSLFIVPNCTYLTNKIYLPEGKEEKEQIKEINNFLMFESQIKEKENVFNELISKVQKFILGDVERYLTNGAFIYNKDIIKRMFPELVSKLDKDGLIDLKELTPLLPGIYKIDEYVIFAHKYFRRAFSYLNTLNKPFLECFESINEFNLSKKISLDFDIIGLAKDQTEEIEYQYWWGPKFDNDLNKIPYGVTVFKNERFDYLLSPYKSTEFGWYEQDDKHTFECEELVEDINLIEGEGYCACRFVHSMVNKEDVPCHLDGAIRSYTLDEFCERQKINIKDFGRDSKYTKLWRIDHNLSVEKWKEVISNFYRDNMLIGEYFDGKDEKIIEPEKDKTKNQINTDSFIPYELTESDGILCNFSFVEKGKIKDGYNIELVPMYTFGDKQCVEKLTCTINKVINSKSLNIYIPEIDYINFGDMIYNMPLYKCKTLNDANQILCILKDFILKTYNKGKSFLFSMSFQIVSDEEPNIIISFAAENTAFYKWFSSKEFVIFPEKNADIDEWLKKYYKLISKLFNVKSTRKIFNYLDEKLVFLKRVEISNEKINNVENTEKGIKIFLNVSEEEKKVLCQNRITTSAGFIEKEVICSCCGSDYHKCSCIAFEKENITLTINKLQLIGYFWTNRKD